ncbi:MAG TPA: cytochrome d ubiquinol oxidase subunit II [Gemmatimonadales bacterium]|nr:cytochrome d ubiquinol oxidase subunit II [Gemmatimonadales bacterium]
MTLAGSLAAIILVALTAYALLGGADFGGGVWHLLASGPRKHEQRRLIAHAIAPVWEANHVWLILAIVLLFTCFSPAFARVAVTLHVPLTLMLLGIVLRGSGFVFQSYGGKGERTFALASLLTPLLLGVSVGAIASGSVRDVTGEEFVHGYIRPWFTPFALAVGFFALACFAFLAAVYLTLEARNRELQEDFRRRAIFAGVAVFAIAAIGLLLSPQAPLVQRGLLATSRAAALHVVPAIAALTAFWALWRRRYRIARIAAAAQVALILWGWGLSQYPYLVPPDLTIANTAAPRATLELALVALLAGAIVLFPSLFYLFKVFKAGSDSVR